MKAKFIIVMFFLFAVSPAIPDTTTSASPLPLSQESAERWRTLLASKKTLTPPRETFLPEDGLGQEIPISAVSQQVRNHAEQWVRKLVRSKWLPDDIQSMMKARKDALLHVIQTPGHKDYRALGDFIVLDFEIDTHRFVLVESGQTLVARIHFPVETELTKVTGEDMVRIVARYFTVPASAIRPGEIKIEGDDQLRSYTWTNGPSDKEIDWRYENEEVVEWWYRLRLHFDGRMLVIEMPEIDDPPRYTARMSLPDRF